MGKPAARLGDQCAHPGSVVVVGFPMVLIGGQPAARIGDMIACPLVTPVGPVTVPHVGGAIIPMGPPPMVLIGGQPAARMGDQCMCVTPGGPVPNPIMAGAPTVLIGP